MKRSIEFGSGVATESIPPAQTFIRFKATPSLPPATLPKQVTLPLHQRVSLLKQQFPGISTDEALKAIVRERGQVPVADKEGGVFDDAGCRGKAGGGVLSPPKEELVEEEGDDGRAVSAQVLNVFDRSVLAVVPGTGLREFQYNGVFDGQSTQQAVYAVAVQQVRRVRSGGDFISDYMEST